MRHMHPLTWPLGALIRRARETKGLARTTLAKFAGISPNSMVRYEMAGRPDGKYPPLPKLVKICEILEIDPRNVFDAMYPGHTGLDGKTKVTPLEKEPGKEKIFSFTKHFQDGMDMLDWKLSVKNIEGLNDQLAGFTAALHYLNEDVAAIKAAITKNGPDQKSPSRSHVRKKNTEAVDAASTSQKKKKRGGD